ERGRCDPDARAQRRGDDGGEERGEPGRGPQSGEQREQNHERHERDEDGEPQAAERHEGLGEHARGFYDENATINTELTEITEKEEFSLCALWSLCGPSIGVGARRRR